MKPVPVRQVERTLASPLRRTIACLILGLLCFQLSRVYLVAPADAFVCAMSEHDHHGTALSHADHDRGEEALEALTADQDDGHTYITHCKDTLDGFGLTPAQPYGAASAMYSHTLLETAIILARESILPPGNVVPPPFQPPRTAS